MDVDDDSFEENMEQVSAHLRDARFISIDLEMTGIHVAASVSEVEGEKPELRYSKAKRVAEAYGILQVGICCFLECEGGYQSFPYNFYLFPRPINEPPLFHSQRFSIDADAMNFNRHQNFDFTKWAKSGITYCNREVEASLRKADEFFESFGGGDDAAGAILAEETKKHLFTKKMEWYYLGVFKHDAENLRTAMGIIRKEPCFKDVVLEKHSGHLTGCRLPRVYARKKKQPPNSDWDNATMRFERHLGFRRVWKILCALSVPIIFHNGLLDLLFLFHHLEAPLPESYSDFCAMIAKTWPSVQVFDTKLLCECDFARNEMAFESSGLQSVFTAIIKCDKRQSDVWQHDKYKRQQCPHEAGYDAMCTGIVFRFFEQVARDSVWNARDLIYLWESSFDFGVKNPRIVHTLRSEDLIRRRSFGQREYVVDEGLRRFLKYCLVALAISANIFLLKKKKLLRTRMWP